ncbi:hypothetical protein MSBRW_2781 [Methanosarcina barkeri str. Wiesmoor]|uniref:PKD domain-containing protein n=1 Tax=Methanosarcina barkeri str. Wiesmoor TaxID=1434109 RepID=A0A0E3QNP7_METBA|nr:PKD domain-containing protein [Methanosarcina barkeri]AKB52034.1 hypothetical protein MSBRW_2781 [Methanosarcina barkeri str. Wiesmoor]
MKVEEHNGLIILVVSSLVFCAATIPVQAAQSDVVESPTANFFAFSTSGNVPFDAAFMDTSKGNPTEWYWEFGDGGTSTQRDPDHTYSEPGSYTVILTASNDAGSDVATKAGYIIVKGSTTNTESTTDTEFTKNIESTENTAQEPVAKFSATPKSGNTPLTVEFTDKSTETPTDWYWTFGDGYTSTQQNPEHTYSEVGSYTVTLTATNDAGSDKKTKAGYIKVEESATDTDKPVADFFASVTSGNAPFTAVFMDGSVGNPTDWYWDFGDGATSSQRDPTHTYSEPGSYTVILTASNDAGSDVATKAGYIIVKGSTTNTESTTDTEFTKNIESTENTAQEPVAKFSATPKSGNTPLTVEFTDKSTETPTDWYWTFGDGYTSTQQNPEHTYFEVGSYTVTLTATNDAGSDKKTKAGYIKVEESATDTDKPVADFFASVTSGNAPFTAVFMDGSVGNPTDWYWDFGDGATSSQRDPTHTYSEPGSYTVTLTASNDAGSDKKTKTDYITVTESTTNTESKTNTEISASKVVSLYYLQLAATSDPERSQGGTTQGAVESVKIVEAALAEEGLLSDKYAYDGSYGTATLKAYKTWQKSIGSAEKYCDGIPGKKDLTKLGNKYGFTVDTSTISYSDISDSEADANLNVPVAKFSGTPKSGNTPLTVEFTDESIETPTDWYWTFGDGYTSTQQNPEHTYSEAGRYTVTLTATNDAGSDKVTKTGCIKVKEPTKDTEISASTSVSLSYLQVAAESDPARSQGKTTPGATDSVKIVEAALVEEGYLDDAYAYDGAYGSATINAYKQWQESLGSPAKYCDGIPGKKDLTKLGNKYGFTVDTSTVADSYLFDSEEDTTKLDVPVLDVPVADFSASTTYGDAPLKVRFNDESTGSPTKWKWTFGDGSSSEDTDPRHTYSNPGKYTVTLKAINEAGSDTEKKSEYITVTGSTASAAKIDTCVYVTTTIGTVYKITKAGTNTIRLTYYDSSTAEDYLSENKGATAAAKEIVDCAAAWNMKRNRDIESIINQIKSTVTYQCLSRMTLTQQYPSDTTSLSIDIHLDESNWKWLYTSEAENLKKIKDFHVQQIFSNYVQPILSKFE